MMIYGGVDAVQNLWGGSVMDETLRHKSLAEFQYRKRGTRLHRRITLHHIAG
jgi:hypothetical protein